MKARPYPLWISRLFVFCMGALAFTGFASFFAYRPLLGLALAGTGDVFVGSVGISSLAFTALVA